MCRRVPGLFQFQMSLQLRGLCSQFQAGKDLFGIILERLAGSKSKLAEILFSRLLDEDKEVRNEQTQIHQH